MDRKAEQGAPSARADSEHDELIARLADLYVDEYWAEIRLHSAAQSLDEDEAARDVKHLVKCAHEYRIVCRRIEDMKEGVSLDLLYGLDHGLVIGTALQLAERIRIERNERAALAKAEGCEASHG